MLEVLTGSRRILILFLDSANYCTLANNLYLAWAIKRGVGAKSNSSSIPSPSGLLLLTEHMSYIPFRNAKL